MYLFLIYFSQRILTHFLGVWLPLALSASYHTTVTNWKGLMLVHAFSETHEVKNIFT